MDCVVWLKRALQIASLARMQGLPECLKASVRALYDRALAGNHYVNFVNVAELAIDRDLLDLTQIAADAESLASARAGGDYPMAVQSAWNLAAAAHARLSDKDAERRCREASVDETLRMREQAPIPAGALAAVRGRLK